MGTKRNLDLLDLVTQNAGSQEICFIASGQIRSLHSCQADTLVFKGYLSTKLISPSQSTLEDGVLWIAQVLITAGAKVIKCYR